MNISRLSNCAANSVWLSARKLCNSASIEGGRKQAQGTSNRFMRAVVRLFVLSTFLLLSVPASAQIAFRSVSFNDGDGITSLNITKPAGAVQDDLMLAYIAVRRGDANLITAPSGWTRLFERNQNDNDGRVGKAVFFRVHTASEPGSYTFGMENEDGVMGTILAYQGVDTVSPIVGSGSGEGDATSATAPSVSYAGQLNTRVVRAVGWERNNNNISSPGTERVDQFSAGGGGGRVSITVSDAAQVGTVNTGTAQFTNGDDRRHITSTIVLREAIPLIGVVKQTSTPTRNQGQQATYTIAVTNTGKNTLANDVRVTDTLPANFTFASATFTRTGTATGPGGSTSGALTNTGSATVPVFEDFTIPRNSSITITLIADISQTVSSGTATNSATASSETSGFVSSNGNVNITVSVIDPAITIDIETSQVGNISPPGQADYTIVVDNSASDGPFADDVVISNTLPSGFTYRTGSVGQVGTCTNTSVVTPALGQFDLVWGTWDMEDDCVITISYTVDISVDAGIGVINDDALVSGSNFADVEDDGTQTDEDVTLECTGDDKIQNSVTATTDSDLQPSSILSASACTLVIPSTGFIAGTVWLDEDQDGINDIEEARLTNILVELQDGTCTTGVDCRTVLTDQFGNYTFSQLPSGNYSIVVDPAALPATLPTNTTLTAGQYGQNPRTVVLTKGQEVHDQDFGYIASPNTGIIGDRVWSDADGDGIQDVGEAGLAGVTLRLFDSSDTEIASTVSTADGDYLFTGVPLGTDYVVKVDQGGVLTGYDPTLGPQSEGSYESSPITITAATTTITDIDFGFDSDTVDTFTITDRVWFDANNDGDDEGGVEPGIAGVTMELLNSSGQVVATTVTDSNGDFSFSGVPDGSNYSLKVSDGNNALANMVETTNTGGTEQISGLLSETADDNGPVLELDTVGDDGTSTFGYNRPGSISGVVWSDSAGPIGVGATQDNGEPGIGGVVVTLTPPAFLDLGNGPGIAISRITGPDGSYEFGDLPPADYTLEILSGDQPSGTHTKDPNSNQDNETTVSLRLGDSVIGQDFGYRDAGATYPISGTVFLDRDKDGVEEAGEPGFEDVTLALAPSYEVVDGRLVTPLVNVARAGTATQSSTGSGGLASRAIDGNDDGVYNNGSVSHTGNSTTNEWIEIDLGSIQTIDSIELFNRTDCCEERLHNAYVLVSDTPFPADGSDPANLVAARAIADFEDQLPASTPDGVIAYAFNVDGVSGRYIRIQKSEIDNFQNILSLAEVRVLAPVTSTYAGYTVIDGAVDINGDGVIDANDDGFINGVDIIDGLFDLNGDDSGNGSDDGTVVGDPIATTTTDSNGDYSFNGLPNGDYVVSVTDDKGVVAGYDITSGLDALNVEVAGAAVEDVDFGYIKDEETGSIAGEVWIDEAVINNLAEDSETNLSGVTVYLCDLATVSGACDGVGETPITQTVTDARGEYKFTNLPSGSYVVGTDPATIPDDLQSSWVPPTVALSEGEDVTEVDVGYIPDADTGVLAGFVWTDVNGTGQYEPGEAPIGGVTIEVRNSAGQLVGTTTTKVDGTWVITGIEEPDLADGLFVSYVTGNFPAGPAADLNINAPTNLGGDTFYAPVDLESDVTNDDGFIGNLDFGFAPLESVELGAISGTIYSDDNVDGDYVDVNDGEFQAVTLNLVDCGGNGCGDANDVIVATTSTDQNGDYSFTGLADGTYQVVVSDHGDVLQDLNPFEVLPGSITIDTSDQGVPANYLITGVDAGYVADERNGSVGNRFWFDLNADGIAQDDEPGIPGITIQCWADNDRSETPDDPTVASTAVEIERGVDNLIRTVVTDKNGEYYCTSMPTGQYIVDVFDSLDYVEGFNLSDDGTLITGSAADNRAKPWRYVLTTNSPNLTADFGVKGSYSIAGNVFIEDEALVEPELADGNQTVTPGVELDGTTGADPNNVSDDDPAEGVTVGLYFQQQPNGPFTLLQTTQTDALGDYSFGDQLGGGLPDGTYRVVVQPSGSVIDGFGQTGDPDLSAGLNGNGTEDLVCDSPTSNLCDDASIQTINGASLTDVNFGYQKNFATTPVTLTFFKAQETRGGVMFTWESMNEVGHFGYQIYARVNDDWKLLTDLPIVSGVKDDALSNKRYEYFYAGETQEWFTLVDVSAVEVLTLHGPYRLNEAYGSEYVPMEAYDWSQVSKPTPSLSGAASSLRLQRKLQRLKSLDTDREVLVDPNRDDDSHE